ncbi:MAG TPA: septal ring lytic transglycosylase RlpA family protein [Rhodopila sp.]|nr:septal ring lytic transglycosylase RlpA family protein [Rhodopila sp.]
MIRIIAGESGSANHAVPWLEPSRSGCVYDPSLRKGRMMYRLRLILCAGAFCGVTGVSLAELPPDSPEARQQAEHLYRLPPVRPSVGHVDYSGRKQTGRASYYGKEFYHRTMADGNRMHPNADAAASKSLPLGSVAKVTNLDNGQSTTVQIEDRGPYVSGRIIDLTPKAADRIDLTKQGVAPVEVKPITVPTQSGGVKLGAGAAEASPGEIESAVRTTEQHAGTKEVSR